MALIVVMANVELWWEKLLQNLEDLEEEKKSVCAVDLKSGERTLCVYACGNQGDEADERCEEVPWL